MRGGAETTVGAFFKPGHDKFAESAVIGVEYGSVANFLDKHGYGPGGKNSRQEWPRGPLASNARRR